MKKSTLVTIAVAFLAAIVAVIWVCYISFRGSVMSFEATNAPGPQVTPPPTRPPPPVAVPAPVRAPAAAPTQAQDVFPVNIPTIAPTVVTPAPVRPNGPPPPDG